MKNTTIINFLVLCTLCCVTVFAQAKDFNPVVWTYSDTVEDDSQSPDSAVPENGPAATVEPEEEIIGEELSAQPAVAHTLPGTDSAQALVLQPKIAKYNYDAIPKDPVASLLFSATFPGAGQLYNKEYIRGILTGVVFWGSFFAIQYEMYRWEQINTDTFYVEEAYNSNVVHMATAPKPEDQMVGLPTAEKVVLGVAVAAAGASYIFGIFDSFNGAKRYNKKLFALSDNSPNSDSKLNLSLVVNESRFGVQARYRW